MSRENYLRRLAQLIRDEIPTRSVPSNFDTEPLFLTYAVLLRARGTAVTAQDVHNAWVAWMLTCDPNHEALVPYEDLPPDVARQDDKYVEAIRRVAARGGATPRQ
ncbi:DUF7701 domain-containing protein [Polymorphospora lycopeni]|uniref:DUF7701 domain-containing protein n=1 Tax=Polymorphospora lycopeni TaxID=3140240 RepID=UPI0040648143